jgi:multiple sugar transport system substrate-binding protein
MTDGESNPIELTRRAALGLLGAGAIGYAAWGPRGGRDPRARGRTSITYWEKWGGHEAAAMQRVVDRFNSEQSEIHVRMLTISQIEQKALIAIAGGSPPDVVGLYNKSLPLFAESGAILPLGSWGVEHGLVSASYGPAIWKLCQARAGRADRKELYGVPNTCSTMALYYSRDAFQERGLDPDKPPSTIAELDACADVLTTTDTGRTGASRYSRLGFVQTEPGWWPHVWGSAFGGSLYDEARDAATIASDAANVRAYEWVQGTSRRLGVADVMGFASGLGSYSSAQQPLLAGRVAMCMHGPFLVNVIKQYQPAFNFGVAPFPVSGIAVDDANPVGLVEADVLCIPSMSKHPEAAKAFLAFTQRQDVVEELAIAHAKPSPLAKSSREYYAGHPNPWIGVHEAIARSSRGFGYPATRVWNEYDALIRRAFEQEIWQQGAVPMDTLTRIQRDAQDAMDRAARFRNRRAPITSGGPA